MREYSSIKVDRHRNTTGQVHLVQGADIWGEPTVHAENLSIY